MHDDEKMFNIGLFMLIGVVVLIMFLQVCYRVQNENLKVVRNSLENVRHDYALAETKFSKLSSSLNLVGHSTPYTISDVHCTIFALFGKFSEILSSP